MTSELPLNTEIITIVCQFKDLLENPQVLLKSFKKVSHCFLFLLREGRIYDYFQQVSKNTGNFARVMSQLLFSDTGLLQSHFLGTEVLPFFFK